MTATRDDATERSVTATITARQWMTALDADLLAVIPDDAIAEFIELHGYGRNRRLLNRALTEALAALHRLMLTRGRTVSVSFTQAVAKAHGIGHRAWTALCWFAPHLGLHVTIGDTGRRSLTGSAPGGRLAATTFTVNANWTAPC
jgi:hypothetical protein